MISHGVGQEAELPRLNGSAIRASRRAASPIQGSLQVFGPRPFLGNAPRLVGQQLAPHARIHCCAARGPDKFTIRRRGLEARQNIPLHEGANYAIARLEWRPRPGGNVLHEVRVEAHSRQVVVGPRILRPARLRHQNVELRVVQRRHCDV
ncbi:hypothetical protein Mapa_005655 [Marchantia paleacea]|nr:hypothetical protein Mapa_005655 [Marchantia paleacea]